MGFSVVPKEPQYLTAAEVLPFKLLGGCCFLSSQPSGNPHRQAMLAVM